MISGNMTSRPSRSYWLRKNRLVFLTGGLVSCGAIGWLAYKKFKTQFLDCKAIMTIAASLASGMGIYLTGSALVYILRKSDDEEEKPIFSKRESDSSDQHNCSLCEKFVDAVTELDRKFEESRAKEYKCLNNKTIMNKTQNRTGVLCKNGKIPKSINDPNQKGQRTLRNRIAKFREEIFSCVSELKGYVQGTIDPLPSARSILFVSTEMSDEMRQQVSLIVKEYANSMLPKLDQVIDEFGDSVCKAVEVLNYDREQKMKKVAETLRAMREDLSKELNDEINQYNIAKQKVSKESLVPSAKKDHSEIALENKMPPPESVSRPSLQDKGQGDRTLHKPLPKLQISASSGTLCMSEDSNENTRSNLTAKLILSEEQMDHLNLLKSEL